jgi:hypothetical protein
MGLGKWGPFIYTIYFKYYCGFLTRDFFVGFGTNFRSAIFTLPYNYIMSDIEFINLFFKLLPLLMSLSGAGLAFFICIPFISLL